MARATGGGRPPASEEGGKCAGGERVVRSSPGRGAEVATALACRFQTASCALTRLWGLGCVERAEDPDRRKRAFRLTESGLRDVHDADLWLEGVAHQALARVTDEHIAAFHELLARFEGAMREHLLTLQSLPARPRRRRTRAGGAAGPRAAR